MSYPLPISSNFKLFNYVFKEGNFANCAILWPAKFLKADDKIGPEHVFILKNAENHFFHVYWKWDGREPELLLKKHWNACFQKELHKSTSNRYLFCAHGQSLLLPYVPHNLHKQWTQSKIDMRDDAFVASYYEKYFDMNIFDTNKKRFERFPGWQKKILKNPIDEYVKYMAAHKDQNVPLNLTKKIEDLNKDEKQILKQASALLHAIFPNFSYSLEQQSITRPK